VLAGYFKLSAVQKKTNFQQKPYLQYNSTINESIDKSSILNLQVLRNCIN